MAQGTQKATQTQGFQAFIPDYIFEKFVQSDDPQLKAIGETALIAAQEARAMREDLCEAARIDPSILQQSFSDGPGAQNRLSPTDFPPPVRGKFRYVYDLKGSRDHQMGELILRPTDDPDKAADPAAQEAFQYSGVVYDFYKDVFGRDSLDDNEMNLISCVHWGRDINNAFWDGRRMVYGDGDGKVFNRFTKSLDVIAHEMTHGVQTHTSNLKYYGEPGALNESFSDVFGVLIKQWHLGQNAEDADWLIGGDLPVPGNGIRAIRDMGPEKAYVDHPLLGTDPQPKHYKDRYTGPQDNAGVHINSSIPNLAFYKVAKALGGPAWEAPGKIWYTAMADENRRVPSNADFAYFAAATIDIAREDYGPESAEFKAVQTAWAEVGVDPSFDHEGRPKLRQEAEQHMPKQPPIGDSETNDPPPPANDPLTASSYRPRNNGDAPNGADNADNKRGLSGPKPNGNGKPSGPGFNL